jgi:VWFA-related protein
VRKLSYILTTLLLVALSAWPFAAVSAQGETPQLRITQVDNSKFPNVTVYVSATNTAGEPVGVDPSTIQIYENGQLMQITDVQGGGEVVGQESIPVTTMLVMDISGSMDKNNKLAAAKEAAKSYVAQMRPGDQAGLITYDTKVYTVQNITADKTALTNAIDGLKTGSDTAMYNALVEAEKALAGASGRKAIIVLTDGLDNKSQAKPDDVINGIGQSGLTVSAIGFGDASTRGQSGLDEAALKFLAEKSGGVYGYADNAEVLKALYQQQSRAMQSEYRVTYISPSPLRNGINRNITVSLTSAPATTAEGKYNPGGVLPEVTSKSWSTFGIILAGLLVLLVVPMLFSVIREGVSSAKRKSGGRSFGKSPQAAARGRIKLK